MSNKAITAYSLKGLLSLHLEFIRPKLVNGVENMKKFVTGESLST